MQTNTFSILSWHGARWQPAVRWPVGVQTKGPESGAAACCAQCPAHKEQWIWFGGQLSKASSACFRDLVRPTHGSLTVFKLFRAKLALCHLGQNRANTASARVLPKTEPLKRPPQHLRPGPDRGHTLFRLHGARRCRHRATSAQQHQPHITLQCDARRWGRTASHSSTSHTSLCRVCTPHAIGAACCSPGAAQNRAQLAREHSGRPWRPHYASACRPTQPNKACRALPGHGIIGSPAQPRAERHCMRHIAQGRTKAMASDRPDAAPLLSHHWLVTSATPAPLMRRRGRAHLL